MSDAGGLFGLFISSFLASTLLPGGSEAALLLSAYHQIATPGLLILIATLGNTLGGMTSWGIGWWLRRRFPDAGLKKPEHAKALDRIGRYGGPVLLLSWLPVVGDPLCVAAGWARIGFLPALLYIALGKGVRYLVLVQLFNAQALA